MIDLEPVRDAVTECFASDTPLIEHYHVYAGRGLRACIEKTMHDVARFDRSFEFYPVHQDSKLVAYWGTEFGRYVNLIFVKPDYRRSSFLKGFWKQITDSVSPTFYAGLYKKNTPAIRFYSRHGKIIESFEHDGHPMVVFKFDKEGA